MNIVDKMINNQGFENNGSSNEDEDDFWKYKWDKVSDLSPWCIFVAQE